MEAETNQWNKCREHCSYPFHWGEDEKHADETTTTTQMFRAIRRSPKLFHSSWLLTSWSARVQYPVNGGIQIHVEPSSN
ncbi:hypothetical protein I7I50_04235 [Histoplasma capsulatum G186AR]|uniref:Uncharacterized protein n=1 Tax=Ajellomyces capsulatus TaxID=5037 RepID=A0A8H7YQ60_AJECA|nr:hypothetical protein I7I52_05143 [Histoplasma capsulatum]QSS75182.1 hypothetical protein I7I50_04235 [Histoplasma capsulatum G186AR]